MDGVAAAPEFPSNAHDDSAYRIDAVPVLHPRLDLGARLWDERGGLAFAFGRIRDDPHSGRCDDWPRVGRAACCGGRSRTRCVEPVPLLVFTGGTGVCTACARVSGFLLVLPARGTGARAE